LSFSSILIFMIHKDCRAWTTEPGLQKRRCSLLYHGVLGAVRALAEFQALPHQLFRSAVLESQLAK
jgi:hypothetical protein